MGKVEITTADEKIIEEAFTSNQDEVTWPAPLAPEAYHGLAGDIVRTIEPHTEADPAALLFSLFVLFGNVIGRRSYFVAEADRHYCNLFACLVGNTSKGRKGVSLGQVKQLFDFQNEWSRDRVVQGLSSGEGLIWQVRDQQTELKSDKNGDEKEVILVDGIEDKRLVCVESEFASTIRVLKREGNTLSAIVRKAWDDGNLQSLTKNSPAKSTDAHISILSHITKDELLRYLEDTEAANGFGNRFLWSCVKRSKCLPEGGRLHETDMSGLKDRLNQAVEYGSRTREIKRDEEARQLWHNIYPELSEGKPGLTGAMLARAEAQVMRLACIYALLDCADTVSFEHLTAALAVWDYCEQSANYIFGDSMGDPVADSILELLREAGAGGASRTDISNHFSRNKKPEQISRALKTLESKGLAVCEKFPGNNRPIERWFITEVNS